MTERDFINEIQDEITGSGSLPVVLDEKEIKRVINQTSRWFYDNYGLAVETHNYLMPKAEFTKEEFRKNRTFKMPDCVVSVYGFTEINGIGRLGNIDKDFSEDRLIASEIFISSFHGDDLVMRVANYQYYDLAKAFFLTDVSYDFNKNTKNLTVLGRDPKFDMFIKTYVKIPLDTLYDDYYFLRYCTGQCKLSYARIIGLYPFPLPGGVELNPDILRDEGQAEIEWVREQIDNENTTDWFDMFH